MAIPTHVWHPKRKCICGCDEGTNDDCERCQLVKRIAILEAKLAASRARAKAEEDRARMRTEERDRAICS